MEDQRDIFERAKRQLSVPDALRHEGARVRGDNFARNWRAGGRKGRLKVCPICGSKGESFSFCQTGWKCHSAKCNTSGSVVDLIARLHNCSPLEAAKRIVGEDDSARQWKRDYLAGKLKPQKIEQPQPSVDDTPAFEPARFIWLGAVRVRATLRREAEIIGAYLDARGVSEDVWRSVLSGPDMAAYPGAPYQFDEAGHPIARHPAMVALVRCGPAGRKSTGGIHCTYLAPDFRAKADVKAAKKMWGAQGADLDGITLPGGVVLIPPKEGGWLCVAEGIETVLCLCSAVRRATGEHAGAFATLSLNRLQGGMALNKWGRADYFRPAIDPERPPALLPHPGGRVIIGVDHDMSDLRAPEKVDAETGEITPGKIIASGARRAQVCALLAGQWWARPMAQGGAGARLVRPAIPPKGKDWGDVMQGLAA